MVGGDTFKMNNSLINKCGEIIISNIENLLVYQRKKKTCKQSFLTLLASQKEDKLV